MRTFRCAHVLAEDESREGAGSPRRARVPARPPRLHGAERRVATDRNRRRGEFGHVARCGAKSAGAAIPQRRRAPALPHRREDLPVRDLTSTSQPRAGEHTRGSEDAEAAAATGLIRDDLGPPRPGNIGRYVSGREGSKVPEVDRRRRGEVHALTEAGAETAQGRGSARWHVQRRRAGWARRSLRPWATPVKASSRLRRATREDAAEIEERELRHADARATATSSAKLARIAVGRLVGERAHVPTQPSEMPARSPNRFAVRTVAAAKNARVQTNRAARPALERSTCTSSRWRGRPRARPWALLSSACHPCPARQDRGATSSQTAAEVMMPRARVGAPVQASSAAAASKGAADGFFSSAANREMPSRCVGAMASAMKPRAIERQPGSKSTPQRRVPQQIAEVRHSRETHALMHIDPATLLVVEHRPDRGGTPASRRRRRPGQRLEVRGHCPREHELDPVATPELGPVR